MYIVKRNPNNPLVSPQSDQAWQDLSTCNPCPVNYKGKKYILFRAISKADRLDGPDLTRSTIGIVEENNPGSARVLIEPSEDWDQYGCEDPRVTYIDGKYYIFYTALSDYPLGPDNIKVGVAISTDLKTIDEKHLITPFNAKAMSLFPEKINGKYWLTFNAFTDKPPAKFCFATSDSIKEFYNEAFWHTWLETIEDWSIDLRRNDSEHTEVGAPPVKTTDGWLMIYSHIQNYFTDQKIFGFETILLDKDNPLEVVGRTRSAFAVPQESYEKYGYVPNVIFPTGVTINDDRLEIFYGGADTTSNSMSLHLPDLLSSITSPTYIGLFERYEKNPILEPTASTEWEAQAVFNPAALDIDGTVHILYRAMSYNNTSVIGYARSKDGTSIDYRHPEPIYSPRADFEQKVTTPDGFSGCEDPRLTIIDDTIYMCYTAYNGVEPPRVAITNISIKDFTDNNWDAWSYPVLISPAAVDDKDACVHPGLKDGKPIILHRIKHHLCADVLSSLDFKDEFVDSCIDVMGPRPGMWDGEKIGIAGPPIETSQGWLLIYHGVSNRMNNDAFTYAIGAALFSTEDPLHLIARTSEAIMVPSTHYEINGVVNNVVFPCGSIIRGDNIIIYYGGGDKVVGVAKASLSNLLQLLTRKLY
jgi:predicted GH43/DUF377 family glycosyl hydrolase